MLGYRDWAHRIYNYVRSDIDEILNVECSYTTTFEQLSENADLYVLVGWSDIIPKGWYKERLVVVLHPSPLPMYRGGSPIQHQILQGETKSAVTLFKLDPAYPAVDSGPIYGSLPYSLEGDLAEIFDHIVDVGAVLVRRLIEDLSYDALVFTPQDESQATTFKRRKPEESEIVWGCSGKEIHDKVRALQDPYPNAYVQFSDGRLYITHTRWEPR